MGFLSKLFKRNRTEEKTVRIPSEVSKVIDDTPASIEKDFVHLVLNLSKSNKFNKDYKLVRDYLAANNAEKRKGGNRPVSTIPGNKITDGMKTFIKQYRIRGLKCSDSEFQSWITEVNI